MILVTGATGKVGRHVVSQLRDAGVGVRALTRTPEAADLPDGVEVVRGDLSAADALDASLDGVDAVFLVWPFLTTDGAPAVLEVIARHAKRLVYLSSMGERDANGRRTDPISFHADMEHLIAQSGPDWTFLRPSGFASNTLMWAEQIRTDGVVRWPYADAARSLIHERDVAAVAVRSRTARSTAGPSWRRSPRWSRPPSKRSPGHRRALSASGRPTMRGLR